MSRADTTGDNDESHELAFPECAALPGLDAAALSLARHGSSGTGRSPNDVVPSRLHPLHAGRRRAGPDASRAGCDVLLSVIVERIFRRTGSGKVFFCSRDAADEHEQHYGKKFIRIFPTLALAGRAALAGRSMAARSRILQPSVRWRIPVTRTRTPQAIHHGERSRAGDVSKSATPPRLGASHPLL